MYEIYQLTNTINGKSYVGFTSKSTDERWKRHIINSRRGVKTHLYCAIRAHGEEAWGVTILECGPDAKIGKEEREPLWIGILKPEYNHTKGGEGLVGYRFSEESKHTLSKRMKGNTYAKGGKGGVYIRTEVHKQVMAAQMVGNKNSLGVKRTEAQNQANSERNKNNINCLGLIHPKVTCPYCHKIGGANAMTRWHFDRCKEKHVLFSL